MKTTLLRSGFTLLFAMLVWVCVAPQVVFAYEECYTETSCEIVGGEDCHPDTVGGGGYWYCDTPIEECDDYETCFWVDDGYTPSCADVGMEGEYPECYDAPAPDLYVATGSLQPIIAYVGVPVLLNTIVSNIGTLAENTKNTFSVTRPGHAEDGINCNPNCATIGPIVVGQNITGPLPPTANMYVSTSYTFTVAGAYYGNECSHLPQLDSQRIHPGVPDRNEYNECTLWVPITVLATPPAQCADGLDNDGNGLTDLSDPGCSSGADTTESGGVLPSVTCDVAPTTVTTGGSATYTATPANGAGAPYIWTASDGQGGLGVGATISRTFAALGTYGMTVRSAGQGNPTATCPQVIAGSCSGTKTGDITALPARVNQGSSATLSWNAQNITTSCVIAGPGVSQTIPAASCTIPTTASFTTPGLTTQSIYTLTCDGTLLDTAIVNVVPKIEEF